MKMNAGHHGLFNVNGHYDFLKDGLIQPEWFEMEDIQGRPQLPRIGIRVPNSTSEEGFDRYFFIRNKRFGLGRVNGSEDEDKKTQLNAKQYISNWRRNHRIYVMVSYPVNENSSNFDIGRVSIFHANGFYGIYSKEGQMLNVYDNIAGSRVKGSLVDRF